MLRNIDTNTFALPITTSCPPSGSTSRAGTPLHVGRDRPDPVQVIDYAEDIVNHLMQREQTIMRDSQYIRGQPDVTERMRTILMDWLVDVAIKFKVHPETFFLAADIVDRYLMRAHVSRTHLQLVGITAMLLAAKHEEIWAPEIRECIYISANTYTHDEVVRMERSIATELNFRFTVPTVYPFMCSVLDRVGADAATRNAALFFLESSSLDYSMLEYLPSHIAAASVFLALLSVIGEADMHSWGRVFFAGCRAPSAVVVDCAEKLLTFTRGMCQASSRFQAIRRKFSSSKFGAVALMTLPESIPTMH